MIGLYVYFEESLSEKELNIFYPYGPLGQGYIVDKPMEQLLKEINEGLPLFISIPILIIFYNTNMFFGLNMSSAFFIAIIIAILAKRLMIIGCKKYSKRVTINERKKLILAQMDKKSDMLFMISGIISSPLLLSGSIWFLFNQPSNNVFVLAIEILSIIYFAIMFIDSFILLKNKFKLK